MSGIPMHNTDQDYNRVSLLAVVYKGRDSQISKTK